MNIYTIVICSACNTDLISKLFIWRWLIFLSWIKCKKNLISLCNLFCFIVLPFNDFSLFPYVQTSWGNGAFVKVVSATNWQVKLNQHSFQSVDEIMQLLYEHKYSPKWQNLLTVLTFMLLLCQDLSDTVWHTSHLQDSGNV